jgi:GxxExxY protein
MENQKQTFENVLYKDETFAIRGAIFEVYREIGSGFLEAVYQESLIKEFTLQNLPFYSQSELPIFYKGEILPLTYRPDFICYGKIILEIKATKILTDDFRAQLHNYLRASGMKLGLLINFGHTPKVEIERIIR